MKRKRKRGNGGGAGEAEEEDEASEQALVCVVDGCTNTTYRNTICTTHRAKLCSVESCSARAQYRGELCRKQRINVI